MFCPTCGNADQQPDSYCRSCGQFVTDHAANSYLLSKLLGGSTPTTQINVNLTVNLLTIFTCFLLIGFLNGHYDALQARTGEAPPTVIYLVYAFLVTISLWQIFSLVVGARLRGRLSRKKQQDTVDAVRSPNTFESVKTRELPSHAEVPLSVTEEPTKILNPTSRN